MRTLLAAVGCLLLATSISFEQADSTEEATFKRNYLLTTPITLLALYNSSVDLKYEHRFGIQVGLATLQAIPVWTARMIWPTDTAPKWKPDTTATIIRKSMETIQPTGRWKDFALI